MRRTGRTPPCGTGWKNASVSYVLAVPKSFTARPRPGRDAPTTLAGAGARRRVAAAVVRDGAKGPRFYDWALIGTASPAHHLLVRRPVSRRRAGVLHLPRPARHRPGRAGAGGRGPVGDRGMLPGRQERDRPGPLPGPPLRRLVPARHPLDAGTGVPPVTAAQRGHQRLWTIFPDAGAA